MGQLVWTEPARDDLKEIYDYIARDSSDYARLTVERILDASRRTADFPKLGAQLLEFPDTAYREVYWRKYRIVYREDHANNRTLVVAVIHGDRDFRDVFGERKKADGGLIDSAIEEE